VEDNVVNKSKQLTIDLHAHIVIEKAEALVKSRPQWAMVQEVMRKTLGERSYQYNLEQEALLLPKSTNVGLRLADMDRLGVDVQVISPSPTQYHFWADPELAAAIVADQNEYVANICSAHPDRFVGIGAVALQHPELGVSQLNDCIKTCRFKGVEISTAYLGVELSDPRFEPFWRRAEELEAVILIHPLGSTLGDRIVPYYLSNIIGQPLDTTIALSHLIFSGVFDRYPKLKVCAVHGGGYLPAYIGRFDHAYRVRPESRTMRCLPSEYLRQIYFDTVVFHPAILADLIARGGIGQVVLGTDYPFDMGDYNIQALLEHVPGIDDAGRDAIRGGNAKALLGL
jgi:Predicted metal-dependent hydrolase of the TIM-barrel fold